MSHVTTADVASHMGTYKFISWPHGTTKMPTRWKMGFSKFFSQHSAVIHVQLRCAAHVSHSLRCQSEIIAAVNEAMPVKEIKKSIALQVSPAYYYWRYCKLNTFLETQVLWHSCNSWHNFAFFNLSLLNTISHSKNESSLDFFALILLPCQREQLSECSSTVV